MSINTEQLHNIMDYFGLSNYKEFATFLETNEERIQYLFRKNRSNKKLKENERDILIKKYFINESWLDGKSEEMINEDEKFNAEFCTTLNKLPKKRQEFYLFTIKAEAAELETSRKEEL